MKIVLRAEGIAHAFGKHRVLEDASLEAHPGHITAMIGPNGAGKTTLLRALAGILRPDRGQATLAGKAVLELPRRDLARRLAFLPQSIAVPPEQLVEDFVLLGRYPHRSPWRGYAPEDMQQLERALTQMEVQALRHREVGTLSGGELQRTILARAIAQDTDFILLDEPANNLDPAHIWRTFETLRMLARAGRGIVLIVHDLQLACRYADSIALVHAGQVCQGEPRQIITEEAIANCFAMEATVSLEAPARVDFIRAIERDNPAD